MNDIELISFDATQRCDRCGAQAYTMASRIDMKAELLFCLHHSRQHRDSLLDEGWTVVDDAGALEELYDGKEITV